MTLRNMKEPRMQEAKRLRGDHFRVCSLVAHLYGVLVHSISLIDRVLNIEIEYRSC